MQAVNFPVEVQFITVFVIELMASAANAAEIYNKNGNKLDLYGKVDGLHYFSDDASEDGDQTYVAETGPGVRAFFFAGVRLNVVFPLTVAG